MSNLIQFLKTKQTVLEMLRDRKCNVNEYFDENGHYIDSIDENYRANSFRLIIKKNENERILVLFYEKKIGIDILKSIVVELDDINIKHAILIVNHKITSFAKKEIVNISSKYYFEIFSQNEMLYNITKHRIIPQHILLTDEEAKKIIDCYGKTFYLPKIFNTDAICKYYDGKVGNIFKILREKSIYYRVVVKDPKK